MTYFPEKSPVEPSFADVDSAGPAMSNFVQEHGVSEARQMIALGYGPFGPHDQNFNPTFRRRYYLTQERLVESLNALFGHEGEIASAQRTGSNEWKEMYDYFIGDLTWFLKARSNVHKVRE